MTSKVALNELFNEANRFSFEESHYSTHDLWEMCKLIEKDLDRLDEITKILTDLIEYEKNGWLDEENIGPFLDKIEEWLENDK